MKTRVAAAASAVAVALAVWTIPAMAGYPMISGLQNVVLSPGHSSGTIVFQVFDDRTGPDSLVLRYSSSDSALVPEDDEHIRLAGSGRDRTVVVTPVAGKTGIAYVTIIVTDTDGETNQDSFEVEVMAPPDI